MAEPPMTSSRLPKGVSTVSMPMEPVTRSDMRELRNQKPEIRRKPEKRKSKAAPSGFFCGQLSYFHPRGGDGVEAAGGQALVALEEAIDGVVLFDVAALELQED